MPIANHGRLFSALLILSLSGSTLAGVTLDFSGLKNNQQAVNATLVLKDSYQLGQPVTPDDVTSYQLSDNEGEKDSSGNWQLKSIDAVISAQGKLVPYPNGTGMVMYDQHDSIIFRIDKNGKWEAVGGRDGMTGTSGLWTMRQSHSAAQTVTPENCVQGDRFHKAAAKGDVNYIQDCLNAGIAVDVQEGNGWTALHAAARQGQVAVIDTLLRYGANPNNRDKTGRTPLDQATLGNQRSAINILQNHQPPPAPIAGGKGSLPPSPPPTPGGSKGSLPPATGGTPAPGSANQASINAPDVVKAAEFASADLARWRPESMTSPYLHSVIRASKQVVAGTNYHLTIKTNDTHIYTFDVVVYEDLQGNMQITESKQVQ